MSFQGPVPSPGPKRRASPGPRNPPRGALDTGKLPRESTRRSGQVHFTLL